MDERTTEDLFLENTKKIENGTDTNVGNKSDELISRQAAIKSVTQEYNRRRTGDGLKLAWIEKAINGTPTEEPKPRWIPCTERMPIIRYDTYGNVIANYVVLLMNDEDHSICKGYFNGTTFETFEDDHIVTVGRPVMHVYAWCPMPDYPKE